MTLFEAYVAKALGSTFLLFGSLCTALLLFFSVPVYPYIATLWIVLIATAALGVIAWSRVLPTRERLVVDLHRIGRIVPIQKYAASDFNLEDVKRYYGSTSFRDYRLFELGTGCNALHTELVPRTRLPYQMGFFQQLVYVLPHVNTVSPEPVTVLEVGFGKGSNLVYLASTFPHVIFLGVDIIEEHVAYATQYADACGLKNVSFHKGDITAAALPDALTRASFDLIFGVESFSHLDTDPKLDQFLRFATKHLKPKGRIVVVDGFRSRDFDSQPPEVQQAMNLAESGFRIKRMASKDTWKSLSADNYAVLGDVVLTEQAAGFWTLGWKVAQLLMLISPVLRAYFALSPVTAESGANFVAVVMTAYAMTLGSAEYGVLVLGKKD